MRERCEVAAGADRTLLRHHRHDTGVEHGRQRAQSRRADARMPAHQRIDADHQHRPHHFRREGLADADRMRDDQVALQFLQQRFLVLGATGKAIALAARAQQLVGIAAEAGGHAIDRLLALHLLGQEVGGALHLRHLRLVEFDAGAPGDGDDLFAIERAPVQMDGFHLNVPAARAAVRSRPSTARPVRAAALRTARRCAGP